MMAPDTPKRAARTALSGAARRARVLVANDRAFAAAAALSAVWLGGVVAYAAGFFGLFDSAILAPRTASALEVALFVLAALAPVSLFFYGALLAHKAEEIRVETARLSSALDAHRAATGPRSGPATDELAAALTASARATLAEEKEAIATALERLDDALGETRILLNRLEGRESEARRAQKRTVGARALADGGQQALPLGAEGEALDGASAGVPWDSVVRALNFPKDADDQAGFASLRQAVADREVAELLQAAEDTLSLLSEDGLYMEDVAAELAPIDIWLRYAGGARGPAVAALGGVSDDVAMAIARGRLRSDPVFRDTALHFLRRYDRFVVRMADELGPDPMIIEASDTRTGRAFMLLSRIAGAFD